MSGICGIYCRDGGLVNAHQLAGMLDQLTHRGRNDSDMWYQNSVGFGHRMLWTTPESVYEHLPMVHPSGQFAITADARLDNRTELCSSLNLNQSGEIVTDSQLLPLMKLGESVVQNIC